MLNCLSLSQTTLEEIQLFLESYALEGRALNERQTGPEARQERMRSFLRRLGDPQETYKTVHIAGTTGKGSTCTYIEALLRGQGFKTGLSLSPHVSDVRERFQVSGELISEERFKEVLERVVNVVRAMEQEEPGAPGYMEFLRGLSYSVFAESRVDYAVVETGIGGLWDSSNTIRRSDKFCVITKLGLDHLSLLGETIDAIALHKMGIVHPGNTVVIGLQEEISQEALRVLAEKRGAQSIWLMKDASAGRSYPPFLPSYLRQNAALAEEVCVRLAARDGWTYRQAQGADSLAQAALPLRFEQLSWKGKTLILDAAHNPQKMRGLVQALRERFSTEALAVAIAFNPDTNCKETLAPIASLNARIACVDVLGGQGLYRFRFSDPCVVAEFLASQQSPDQTVEVVTDWDPLLAWIERVPEQVIVLTGSFHFVASARAVVVATHSN
jgi:dihydrofolate synthase/folylpolyglutamate synthase